MIKVVEFIKGSVAELYRVTWPTKDDVVRATIATSIFVTIFAGILFGVDFVTRFLLQGLMK